MSFDGRPYVDTPVADIAAAGALAARAASHFALPAPTLVRRGMNALFACGDVLVRVGMPSVPGGVVLRLADRLADAGIAVPTPAVGEYVADGAYEATCWRRIEPTGDPVDWAAVGAIVRRVHSLTASQLPSEYPIPSPRSFPWWNFESIRASVADLLDDAAGAGIDAAIARHAGWRDDVGEGAVVSHGDVHPGNVLMTAAGPVLLDWDLLCWAAPGWDHSMLLTLSTRWGGEAGAYRRFAAGYGCSFEDDRVTLGFAELRNVAATLLRLVAGRHDPAAAAEAARRLQYWRGDPDPPAWRAQ